MPILQYLAEIGYLNKEIEKLKTENEKLRECTKYYGNKNNWNNRKLPIGLDISSISRVDEEYYPSNKRLIAGGKKARQTLKELEGDNG